MSAGEARDDDRPLMAVVNDEIQRLHGSLGLFDSEFFCECGHIICKERVTLSRDEFATLRAQSRRLIAPAHVNVGEAPDHQTLAVLADAAAVVEAGAKIGIASHVAAFH